MQVFKVLLKLSNNKTKPKNILFKKASVLNRHLTKKGTSTAEKEKYAKHQVH